MPAIRPLPILCCLAAATLPAPAHAQVLTGRVLDAASGSAVANVTVTLLAESDDAAAQAVSRDDGGFTFVASRFGNYRLRAEALGYEATTSAPFWIGSTDTTVVELRIATQPIELRPLTVVARSRPIDPRLRRAGFYEREEDYRDQGKALFLTADSLNASSATRVTELVRGLSELTLVRDGFRTFVRKRGGGRVAMFLDGHPLKLLRGQSVDEVVALGDIGAVEIYWDWAPAQYGGGAAIVMWTGRW